jgi:hypothetical protein
MAKRKGGSPEQEPGVRPEPEPTEPPAKLCRRSPQSACALRLESSLSGCSQITWSFYVRQDGVIPLGQHDALLDANLLLLFRGYFDLGWVAL